MIALYKTIGILPIKATSQRVPNKNFRLLAGSPLWLHAFNKLLDAHVDRIIINTDADPTVFGCVYQMGPAEVDVRPYKLRAHEMSMNKVLVDVVEKYPADRYIQVHATNPFITAESIQKAITYRSITILMS